MFASDNGGYYNNGGVQHDPGQQPWKAGSNQTISNGWGWVQNTPFNYYKQTSYEGGLAVPFLVRWPHGLKERKGEIVSIEADITDLYPTLLELAGRDYPDNYRGESLKPLTGASFLGALIRGEVFEAPSRFHWFAQSRAYIDGDFKVTGFHDGCWQLFNLKDDRTEQVDLSDQYPEIRERLVGAWHEYAESIGMTEEQRRPERGDWDPAWGWHRLLMVLPGLESVFPENGKLVVPGVDRIELQFREPVDFEGSENRFLSLFKVSDYSNPVWRIDLDSSRLSQDRRALVIEDIQPLEPDTHYFILIDRAAFRVGGKPVGPVNDGAYWWRFRTWP